MRKTMVLFFSGGSLYPLLEIAWRGKTDISMAVAGGTCLCLIDRICNCRLCKKSIFVRCSAGAGIITGVEFLVGVVVNLILKRNVWDYSMLPMNFLGQICIPFTALWYFLSLPAMGFCRLCSSPHSRQKGIRKE
ncbi:conserved protein of unknown function [Ruminococcaceae bacterium BL-6]|jgi:hypothetical protein|nr:conserved protein of unknown function [Ruminococcaceae bacterium BL-6]HBC27493.1 hypothetical protein [Oscillospiraceae bacterium]